MIIIFKRERVPSDKSQFSKKEIERFGILQQQAINWLRSYTSTSYETLLNFEEIQQINRTSLRSLFDSLEFVSPTVKINFYSQQVDIHEEQSFYVEVTQRTSDFRFSIPLHSALIHNRQKKGETISFFKYVFIQIAMVHKNLLRRICKWKKNEAY